MNSLILVQLFLFKKKIIIIGMLNSILSFQSEIHQHPWILQLVQWLFHLNFRFLNSSSWQFAMNNEKLELLFAHNHSGLSHLHFHIRLLFSIRFHCFSFGNRIFLFFSFITTSCLFIKFGIRSEVKNLEFAYGNQLLIYFIES